MASYRATCAGSGGPKVTSGCFQGVLFCIAHVYYVGRVPVAFWTLMPALGLLLGLVASRSRPIGASKIAHALANGLGSFVASYNNLRQLRVPADGCGRRIGCESPLSPGGLRSSVDLPAVAPARVLLSYLAKYARWHAQPMLTGKGIHE